MTSPVVKCMHGNVTDLKRVGAGGFGAVFLGTYLGRMVAFKLFKRTSMAHALGLNARRMMQRCSPDARLAFPMDVVPHPTGGAKGFVMPRINHDEFLTIAECLSDVITYKGRKRQIPLKVRARVLAEFARFFARLHGTHGLVYGDISLKNLLMNPATGEIRIEDPDNIGGLSDYAWRRSVGLRYVTTPPFGDPVLLRQTFAAPNVESDLYSFAVLCFFLLCRENPFDGPNTQVMMTDSMVKKLSTHPEFAFSDSSTNPACPSITPQACEIWPGLPKFARDLLERTLGAGTSDVCARARWGDWIHALEKLEDLVMRCPVCHAEHFEAPYGAGTPQRRCPQCMAETPQVRIYRRAELDLVLYPGAKILRRHLGTNVRREKQTAIGEVATDPQKPMSLALKNISAYPCYAMVPGKPTAVRVAPGESIGLRPGLRMVSSLNLRSREIYTFTVHQGR